MRDSVRRLALFGMRSRPEANLSGAIYGVITATAVIAATSAHSESLGQILAGTVATLVVFWLAHVYAEVLAHHLTGGHRPSIAVVRVALVKELPVIEAPAVSVLLLVLGVLGLLDAGRAVNLALWTGVAQLAAWGVAYARQQGWPWSAAAVAGLINGGLGASVIVLKALIH